jgi:hypothetical protein
VRPSFRFPRRGALAATPFLTLALAAPSHAAEPARGGKITLVVRECERSFEASLREILVIELGDLLERDGVENATEGESIEITCAGETARIVGRGVRGEVVHHDLRLGTFPGDAAPRAAALAALEALRAVDPTLAERMEARRATAATAATAATKPKPAPPAHSPQQRAPAPRDKPAARSPDTTPSGFTRLLAGGAARWFVGEPRTLVFGGRLELSRRFASSWDGGFDIDGTFARRTVDLGVIDARLLSAAAWLGVRAGSRTWSATAGAGARFGVALLTGAPRDAEQRGHESTRPWGGPTLVLRTDAAAGALALALALEGGLAAAGSEGLSGGEPAIGFTTGWVSVSASAGVRY